MATIRIRFESSSPADQGLKIPPASGALGANRSSMLGLGTPFPEVSAEALKLSSKLQASAPERDRLILVAGFNEGESSPDIAVQLAMGLSSTDGQSVLLVDANYREPSLHSRFGVGIDPGLTNVLCPSPAALSDAIRPVKPNLAVLPAGNARADSSIFTSPNYTELLERVLRPRYRFIIVNAAPFVQFGDANLMASRVDGVVITLTSGRHHRPALLGLKNELDSLKSKVYGMVLCEPN